MSFVVVVVRLCARLHWWVLRLMIMATIMMILMVLMAMTTKIARVNSFYCSLALSLSRSLSLEGTAAEETVWGTWHSVSPDIFDELDFSLRYASFRSPHNPTRM